MKRILSLALGLVLALGCFVILPSCGMERKIAGTYEMVEISGTLTMNGQTVELDEDLYDYYRITLNKDGTAEIESKGAGSTLKVEEEGTWEYEDDVIKLKSKPSGITVVEEMEWDDDVITYEAEQSAQGMTIKMTLILEKQD